MSDAKFAEGEKGGCPPWKKGEKIDLRIAHWCLFGPRASGMYETVRELIGAEMKIEGVLPYFCETPSTNKPNAMEIKRAAEGGRIDPMFSELRSQDWGLAMKWADVHVIHSTMSNKVGEIKPKVMWLHGTPEACLQNEVTTEMRSFLSAAEWVNKFEASICTSRRAFKHWGVFDYTGKKLYQVKKGIDLSWWQRSTTIQDLDGEPSVLYGEIWRGIKHPYHLIHAMDTLHKRNPKAVFNTWGCNDPDGFWKKFFSYGNFDRFLGKRGLRGWEEYPSHWYSRGDVLVSPVIHGDVSRTAQEALGCGCPTIVWDSDPYGDNIAYKYAKAFDEDNLADRIEEVGNEVLNDREGMAKKCRELAMKNYDINVEAQQVVDILRTVVSEFK